MLPLAATVAAGTAVVGTPPVAVMAATSPSLPQKSDEQLTAESSLNLAATLHLAACKNQLACSVQLAQCMVRLCPPQDPLELDLSLRPKRHPLKQSVTG